MVEIFENFKMMKHVPMGGRGVKGISWFNYSSGRKIRKFQNDEVPAHGGGDQGNCFFLLVLVKKIENFKNDEVLTYGGVNGITWFKHLW